VLEYLPQWALRFEISGDAPAVDLTVSESDMDAVARTLVCSGVQAFEFRKIGPWPLQKLVAESRAQPPTTERST